MRQALIERGFYIFDKPPEEASNDDTPYPHWRDFKTLCACASPNLSWLPQIGRPWTARPRRPPPRGRLVRGGISCRFSASRSPRLVPAAVVLVDGRPGATLGFLFGDAALLIPSAMWLALRSCLSVYSICRRAASS